MVKIVSKQDKILQEILDKFNIPFARSDVLTLIHNFFDEIQENDQIDPKWSHILNKIKKDWHFDFDPKIERMIKQLEIDPEIERIEVPEDTPISFLLGAGASAPAPSSIPTVGELLPELWKRAKKIGRQDLDQLEEWCNNQGITNIEDLLTAAYIGNFAAKSSNITGLLDYFLFRREPEKEEIRAPLFFGRKLRHEPRIDTASIAHMQDTLQTLFGLLASTMIPAKPNPAHEAIIEFVKHHPKTTIITTNYDGCIDEALLKANIKVRTALFDGQEEFGSAELIKMHGSINWSYCDSCQEVKEFNLLELKEAFENDFLSYAVIGICKTCGGQRRPLLVPPLSFKFVMFPNLIGLWNIARRRIENAKWLFVIGYSFSEADTFIPKMIARSFTVNNEQKMVICDSNIRLAPSIQKRFETIIDNFDKKRILKAVGGCENLLPKIIHEVIKNSERFGNEVKAKAE